MSVESIHVPNVKATCVLVGYLGAVVAVAWALRNRRLRM